MPINIIDYSKSSDGDRGTLVQGLCDDEWELPTQLEAFQKWLVDNKTKFAAGSYIADIGFSPVQAHAGGGVLSVEAMGTMAGIGMELCLSEYPGFIDE